MTSLKAYLSDRTPVPALTLVFLGLAVYRQAQGSGPFLALACIAAAALALAMARPPRWVNYGFLLSSTVITLGYLIFVTANGPQDKFSDRDDAVEIAARSLVEGHNPWNQRSILGLPITTSPTGILASVPVVSLTGRIDGLAFLFWVAFLGVLLAGDLAGRNNTFMVLGSLLLLPESGITHSAFWGLDELYWSLLTLPLAWWAIRRGHLLTAGVLAAVLLMGRLSYALPVAALVGWLALTEQRPWRPLARFAVGGAAGIVLLLLPFAAVGGTDFFHCNFVTVALDVTRTDATPLGGLVGLLNGNRPWLTLPSRIAITASCLGVALLATARRVPNPFWHVALAALLTQCLLFVPPAPADYIFTVLGPALLAVAFTPESA